MEFTDFGIKLLSGPQIVIDIEGTDTIAQPSERSKEAEGIRPS